MRILLLLALAAGGLAGAVVRGDVVENQSGRPLARTQIVAQPVAGTGAEAASVRADAYGAFQFPPLPAGSYIFIASRPGFVSVEYGQRTLRGSGAPLVLKQDSDVYVKMRLPRFGGVSGTVVDENEVGMSEFDVAIFRNTRPPQYITRTKTDERGVYRIGMLEPGRYLLRTMSRQTEDGGYLPTWSRRATRVDQAYLVDADLDRENAYNDMAPEPGRLFQLAGTVGLPGVPPPPATLTLISDSGRETITAAGSFRFNPTAPGHYELVATAQLPAGTFGAYMQLDLDRDRTDIAVPMNQVPELRIQFQDARAQRLDTRGIQVLARRKDLAGLGDPEPLKSPTGATLAPGRWELTLAAPPPDRYVAGFFSGGYNEPKERPRPDGWNEITITPGMRMMSANFRLASDPATLTGTVLLEREKAPGAPVFLEGYDPAKHVRDLDVRTVRTDADGKFEFKGLAPGWYRVMSSFDYRRPEPEEMDLAEARLIRIEQGKAQEQELQLFVRK